jgi:hypothetical protein
MKNGFFGMEMQNVQGQRLLCCSKKRPETLRRPEGDVAKTLKAEQDYTGLVAYLRAARAIRCRTVNAKCLLLYYAVQVDENGHFFKSTLDIAAETGLEESYINRTNADWQEKGILTWTKGNSLTHKANEYTLNLAKLRELMVSSREAVEKAKQTARDKAAARSKKYRDKLKAALKESKRKTVTPISA